MKSVISILDIFPNSEIFFSVFCGASINPGLIFSSITSRIELSAVSRKPIWRNCCALQPAATAKSASKIDCSNYPPTMYKNAN